MASAIAHPFVALALAPFFRRFGVTIGLGVVGAACTIIPDIDAIGFHLGIPYESLFGHRGFTHSLFFAAVLAALLSILLHPVFPRATRTATFVFLFLCTASHGALDALTDGGLGVAFFSPLSNERHFFPWHPIAVSPISIPKFISGRAIHVLASELRWVILPSIFVFLFGWLSQPKGAKAA